LFAVSALRHPCHSPLFPICCSSSLVCIVPRLFIVPVVCHPRGPLLSMMSFPIPCHVVSTSITPYEQWLTGRVVVLCDVAPILVQEKDPLPPCKQRLAAVAWGGWCGMSFSLLSRGTNLKKKSSWLLVVKKRNKHTRGPNDANRHLGTLCWFVCSGKVLSEVVCMPFEGMGGEQRVWHVAW
jgi:hypothetical protein